VAPESGYGFSGAGVFPDHAVLALAPVPFLVSPARGVLVRVAGASLARVPVLGAALRNPRCRHGRRSSPQ
jgi:hypothetical protein